VPQPPQAQQHQEQPGTHQVLIDWMEQQGNMRLEVQVQRNERERLLFMVLIGFMVLHLISQELLFIYAKSMWTQVKELTELVGKIAQNSRF